MTALRYLLAPLWAAQLFTSRKSFSGGLLGSERLNRRGLHVARVRLAERMAWRRRAGLSHLVSPEDRAAFERDGYIEIRDLLPPEHFRALLEEVRSYRGPAREMTEGDAVTRRVALSPALLRRMPALARLVALPGFQGRLRYVSSFDIAPTIYIQTIFSHSATAETDPQTTVHMDTFHPTMKAWLFLQDVPLEDGPFTYVRGSHARTPRRLAWEKRRSVEASRPGGAKGGAFRIDAGGLRRLGHEPPTSFAVPANTLVVGDTSGFHARGASSRPSVRIEIYAYSRRNPFVPLKGGDPWSLPGLRDRQIPLFWWALDLKERLGLGRSVWRKADAVTVSSPPERQDG